MCARRGSNDWVLASDVEEAIFLETISKRFRQFIEVAHAHDDDPNALDELIKWANETETEVKKMFRTWYAAEVIGKRIPRRVLIPKPRQDRIYRSYAEKFSRHKCEVCGDTRVLNIAHIIPRADGGPDEEWNLMRLCANHHYLFDEHKLTEQEWACINWTSKDPRARDYAMSHHLPFQLHHWGKRS